MRALITQALAVLLTGFSVATADTSLVKAVTCQIDSEGRTVKLQSLSLRLSGKSTEVACEEIRLSSDLRLFALQTKSRAMNWKGTSKDITRLEVFQSNGRKVESLPIDGLEIRWKSFQDPKTKKDLLVMSLFEKGEYQSSYHFDESKGVLMDWASSAEQNGWPRQP